MKKIAVEDLPEECQPLLSEAYGKQFGKGALMQLGENEDAEPVAAVSTGYLALDIATGIGGLPRGRIVEIYGPESSGKTTLALHAIAEVQKAGGLCAFIDAEHALDVRYAKQIGVRIDELLVSQPDTGEQALEIVEILTRSGAVDLVVIDSVAALTPKAEIEGEMGDQHMGLQARLMSQALRKLTGVVHRTGTTIVFINQLRQKIGVVFGSPETTTGGNALKFYASMRFDVRRIAQVKVGDELVGGHVRVKVVKNKCAPPFAEAEFDILYGHGISHSGDVVDLASELGIVEKSGAWFSFQGERIGQGRENAKAYLEQHPDLLTKIEKLVLQKHNIVRPGDPALPPAPPAATNGKESAKVAPPPKAADEGRVTFESAELTDGEFNTP